MIDLKQRFDKYLTKKDNTEFEEIEIIYRFEKNNLARFSDNSIIQNVSQKRGEIQIKLIKDKTIGIASTNNTTDEGIETCYQKAKLALKYNSKDEDLLPLYSSDHKFTPQSIEIEPFTPIKQSEEIKKALSYVEENGFQSAGIFSYGYERIAILNNKGIFKESVIPASNFSISITAPSIGWAQQIEQSVSKIDCLKVAEKAVDIAKRNIEHKKLQAGKYDVVLSPEAVADFFTFLSWVGFNGLQFANQTGPFDKLDKKVFDQKLTVIDDPFFNEQKGFPFDFEGVDKKKLTLIENGVLKNVVHDRYSAKKCSSTTTGHSFPQPNSYGPMPQNLVISPGDKTVDQLIESTKYGLYINRFHYCNLINPKLMTLTGMTREGIFLIEDGKLSKAVNNFRFTISILDVLNNIEGISKEVKTANEFFNPSSSIIVPYMKINNFHFTSTTDF